MSRLTPKLLMCPTEWMRVSFSVLGETEKDQSWGQRIILDMMDLNWL